MNNRPRIKLVAVLALLVAGLVIAGCAESTPNQGLQIGPQIGKLAPDFTLPSLDGQTVSLNDLRGQPVFINFWASWCPACREEMPLIQTVHERQAGQSQSAIILGINVGESPSTVEGFMQENELSFPVLLDITQTVAQNYNIRAIPTTFFIDSEGIIREIKIGAFTSVVQIERGLERLTQ